MLLSGELSPSEAPLFASGSIAGDLSTGLAGPVDGARAISCPLWELFAGVTYQPDQNVFGDANLV